MRSIQLPFLMEETLELIGNQQRTRANQRELKPVSGFRRVLAILDKALECDGPTSIANFERIMRGTRSLAK